MVVTPHAQQTELLPLVQPAQEFRVHVRTSQTAVRTGRLDAQCSVKSVCGNRLSGYNATTRLQSNVARHVC